MLANSRVQRTPLRGAADAQVVEPTEWPEEMMKGLRWRHFLSLGVVLFLVLSNWGRVWPWLIGFTSLALVIWWGTEVLLSLRRIESSQQALLEQWEEDEVDQPR